MFSVHTDAPSATLDAQSLLVGIDIGGTNIAAASFTPDGTLLARTGGPTLAARGGDDGIRRILALIDTLQQQSGGRTLAGVGVGSTGPIDRLRGRIQNPFTLPTWDDVPITEALQGALHVPCVLENDAHVAALGELWLGAGHLARTLIYITVGTGVGGALVVDRHLHVGANGMAGEVGHMQVDPTGPLCYCGVHGCVESLASATAMVRWVRAHPDLAASSLPARVDGDAEQLEARTIAEAARDGDALAQAAIQRAAWALGAMARSLTLAFSPDHIVLGGGVMRSFDLFLPTIEAAVRSLNFYVPVHDLRILPAELGLNAGVAGAVRALLDRSFPDQNERL